MKIPDIFEKSGALGIIVASMSCGFLFLASLGASLGSMQLYAWSKHKKVIYLFFGLTGSVTLLILKHFFWMEPWRTEVYYMALASMLIYSVFTMFKPPLKTCCATQT